MRILATKEELERRGCWEAFLDLRAEQARPVKEASDPLFQYQIDESEAILIGLAFPVVRSSWGSKVEEMSWPVYATDRAHYDGEHAILDREGRRVAGVMAGLRDGVAADISKRFADFIARALNYAARRNGWYTPE